MPPKAAVPPTRAEWVDALLRRAILHGELLPGEKLHAERLAEQWGVSPTPLRETFMRLAGEGLVEIEPQRGARVAPLSVAQAVEIYEMRLLLDPAALQRSIAAGGDAAHVREVERAHDALTGRHRSLAGYHEAHRAFHLALVSRCPNQRLVRQVGQLLEHSQRFHLVGAVTDRRTDAADEHRRLVAAVRERDARGGAKLLREHLTATLDAVHHSASRR